MERGDKVEIKSLIEEGYVFSHHYGDCEVYKKNKEFIFVDKYNKVIIILKPN